VVAAAEGLLRTGRQREALALVERNYEDARARRRWRRGGVRFRSGCEVRTGRAGAGVPACLPMPFWSFASTSVVALPAELDVLAGWSPTMVDVDDERLKVLARGARCVSLSSADRQQGQ
jgi:hypothetical protein